MTEPTSTDNVLLSPTITVPVEDVEASFDLAVVPMVLLHADGSIARANLRSSTLLGIATEQLVGRHWTDFVSVDDREAVDRALLKIIRGERLTLESPPYVYRRPDGTDARFDCETRALFSQGRPTLLLAQLNDLGEEHRARVAVQEMLERHEVDDVLTASRRASSRYATDLDGIVTAWSDGTAELLGIPASDAIGRPLVDVIGSPDATAAMIQDTIRGRQMPRMATFTRLADGTPTAIDIDLSQLLDDNGHCIGFQFVHRPHDAAAPDAEVRWLNTQHRFLSYLRTQIRTAQSRDQVQKTIALALSSATSSPSVVVADVRPDKGIRVREAVGVESGTLKRIKGPGESALWSGAIDTGETHKTSDYRAEGVRLAPAVIEAGAVAAMVVPVVDTGDPTRVIAGFGLYRPEASEWQASQIAFAEEIASMYSEAIQRWRDESERRINELHDRLTGLPGRTLLVDRIEQALDRDRGNLDHTAVALIDLDHFKFINDTLGYEVGDRLLQAVVPRLQSILRPGDTVARLSGDDFALVMGELGDESQAMVIAEALQDVFTEPFIVAGEEHTVTASIGLVVAGPGDTPQDLLGNADAAAFRAKEKGRNRIELFDQLLRERITLRVQTERELRGAVVRDELSLRYQPIIDLRNGTIEGVEALVRWQHPQRGLVGPGDFITIAEESGLIVGLGEWVLRTACKQGAQWLRDYDLPQPFRVSVNISARQLGNADLTEVVEAALAESGLPPTCLALEVTESVLIEQAGAMEVLSQLRARGIRLMLDDFGTGYSSLSYLRQFAVDALKIDRSFVSELGENRQDALLVSALIQMASALQIEAVAEGVETAQQAQMLRVLGCELAQGFYFARPLTSEDAGALLAGGEFPGGSPR